ncbi:hypothetical protein [Streptomyces bluensis]|uniref:hypothetical protein n=1 Tax=Streptomyces bluensis TaxID=33897 RepID=UPI00332C424F
MQSPPNPNAATETVRMPKALVLVLVLVVAHALGTAFGGWVLIEENQNKQEHGQDLLLPWALAWFTVLFCWGLAALQLGCAVLARGRRSWVRVVLIVCLSFMALSMAFAFLGSLASGAPNLAAFLIAGFDVAALTMVCGRTGRHYFSVRGSAPTYLQG